MLPENKISLQTQVLMSKITERRNWWTFFQFESKPFREIRVKVGQYENVGWKKGKKEKRRTWTSEGKAVSSRAMFLGLDHYGLATWLAMFPLLFILFHFVMLCLVFLTMVFLLSFNIFPKLKEMVKVKTEKNNKVTEESSKDSKIRLSYENKFWRG